MSFYFVSFFLWITDFVQTILWSLIIRRNFLNSSKNANFIDGGLFEKDNPSILKFLCSQYNTNIIAIWKFFCRLTREWNFYSLENLPYSSVHIQHMVFAWLCNKSFLVYILHRLIIEYIIYYTGYFKQCLLLRQYSQIR